MTKHIVIIGAGVVGLSCAYYCAQRGYRVTVLERNPEQRDGCSYGNAGMITPSHFVPLAAPGMVALGLKWMWNPESPFYIKPRLDWDLLQWGYKFWRAANPTHVARTSPLLRDLNFAGRTAFEELAALPDFDFGLQQLGLVMLCKTQHVLDEEAAFAARANSLGVPAQVMDARQIAALEPAIRMDIAGGIYFPKDCHLSPNRFMSALQAQCVALGVKLEWDAEVRCVTSDAARKVHTVTTSRGEYTPDELVLCAGSWSPVVARDLSLNIPLQAGKGYSLTLPHPRQLPKLCAILTEARVAVTPMGSSLRFGGTMEIAGLNEDINPVRVRGIIKAASRYFPDFQPSDFDSVPPWRGLRPCSPDGVPYIGRTAKFSNLTIATGHAMMGLSLGPITGKMVSEIVSGETPAFDMQLLSPDRYG
jgi:D-amino-acid dehydrogenase